MGRDTKNKIHLISVGIVVNVPVIFELFSTSKTDNHKL